MTELRELWDDVLDHLALLKQHGPLPMAAHNMSLLAQVLSEMATGPSLVFGLDGEVILQWDTPTFCVQIKCNGTRYAIDWDRHSDLRERDNNDRSH